MAITIPAVEPESVVRGDSVKWTKDLQPDYLPASWTLTYEFRGPSQFTLTATDNGDNTHLVSVLKATTANWNEGQYDWDAYVDDGTDRTQVAFGRLAVLKDMAQADAVHDARSHAQRALDLAEAAIEEYLKHNVQGYAVAGKQVQKPIPTHLLELRDRYKAEVEAEKQADRQRRGLSTSTAVKVTA